METRDLARSIFESVVAKLAAVNAGLDFRTLARDAHNAAEAFEAEQFERAKAEQEAEDAARPVLVECPKCLGLGTIGNGTTNCPECKGCGDVVAAKPHMSSPSPAGASPQVPSVAAVQSASETTTAAPLEHHHSPVDIYGGRAPSARGVWLWASWGVSADVPHHLTRPLWPAQALCGLVHNAAADEHGPAFGGKGWEPKKEECCEACAKLFAALPITTTLAPAVNPPAVTATDPAGRPAGDQKSNPAAHWSRIRGTDTWHLWSNDEADHAECGDGEGSEPLELWRHDAPENREHICETCIALDVPAAARWRAAFGLELQDGALWKKPKQTSLGEGRSRGMLDDGSWHIGPRHPGAKHLAAVCGKAWKPFEGAAAGPDDEQCGICERLLPELLAADAEPPAPKKKRAPIVCMVPGCGEKGSKSARTAAGLTITRGAWCKPHAELLTLEDREAIVAAAKKYGEAAEVSNGR